MRKLISLVTAGLLSVSLWLPAQAQISNIAEAEHQAGLQRMLGQRILKDYALVVLDVKVSTYQKDLTDSIKQYNTILADLQGSPVVAGAGVQEILDKVASHWDTFKRLASATPQKDSVSELHHAAEELLEYNEDLAHTLAESINLDAAAVIDISDRQEMLSQRVAALYMLHALGVDEETYKEDMENSAFEFMLGLEELKGSDLNNRTINSKLKKVESQFKMLEFSVNKEGKTYFPFVVSQAAEKILESMGEVTAEYVELAGDS